MLEFWLGDEDEEDNDDGEGEEEVDDRDGVTGHGAGPALREGNARNGKPRKTVDIPTAFPMCEAT